MGKSPGIILTAQFKTPGANFSTYVDYCVREKALLKNGQELLEREKRELSRIQSAMDKLDERVGGTYSKLKKKMPSNKEWEAQALITSPELFEDSDSYEKYIRYAARNYALAMKENRTKSEEEEAALLGKKMSNISSEIHKKHELDDADEILPGVFSKDRDVVSIKDNEDIKKLVDKAEKNGSICYQDVISFDTDFLIQQKIYDPVTKILDEEKIKKATHKMMEQLYEGENIQTSNAFWVGMIHRNTKHIHIHFTTVEIENRRKSVEIEKDGVSYYQPKGTRKQTTLDRMKKVFANELVDEGNELARISVLRDTLYQKEILDKLEKSKVANKKNETLLLQEIYESLPSDRKAWNYNSKKLPSATRKKIDNLTDSLMQNNPVYQEYQETVKKQSHFRKELYGESSREHKDYEKNKMKEIHERMGNAILKELKKKKPFEENLAHKFHQKREQINNKYQKNTGTKKRYPSKYKPSLIQKKDIKNIEKALDDELQKYRAEREFEYIQQQIEREQERE